MKLLTSKLSHSIASCLITLVSASYAHADDTEILFESSAANELTPNVMFILDNSGSMGNKVILEEAYDHSVDYIQKARDDGKHVYSDDYIYIFTSSDRYIGTIKTSKNHCQTMTERLTAAGIYPSEKVAQFYSGAWRDLYGSTTYDVECEDDAGVHGKNGTTGSTYARNRTSEMWTSKKNKRISWRGIDRYDFYSANRKNWHEYYRNKSEQTRLQVMKDVITNLVNGTTGINIGLMSFNTNNGGRQGGRVTTPMGYVDDIRSDFITDMKSLGADTWTPLAETLFEAYHYYSGSSLFLGSQSVGASRRVIDNSDPDNPVYGGYISPIEDECQPNNIILLTDGEPTYDADPTSSRYDSVLDAASHKAIESGINRQCDKNCLDEIARFMYENDVSGLDGKQTVTTYTIGLDLKSDLLRVTAEGSSADPDDKHAGGGGKYYEAENTSELESAIKQIFSRLKEISTTFVSPGVAVNTFNRLNHRDELYFSVFKPLSGPAWQGNLKRYRLGSDGTVYDKNGNKAIDPDTGFFKARSQNEDDPGARSWWTQGIDANDIHLGGAAENLPEKDSDRKLYTFLGNNDLADGSNAISYANTLVTKELLDIPNATDAEHEKLMNWLRDRDVDDRNLDSSTSDTRLQMMDPLHSAPVVVIYGGSDDKPDTTVFLGDNQGFIRAINGREGTSSTYGEGEGQEYFSFMPKELLRNQYKLMDNSPAVEHIYGMDGSITIWSHDRNNNNDLSDDGDFVYLYSGMRRGGNSYYALDVTNRKSPKFKWQITGGSGDFAELGQTWSKPVKTKVKIGKNIQDVLIFGGGYDTDQDTHTTRTTDSIGRAVYIVDADSGKLIWKATPSDADYSRMKYSIPSNVKAIDVNADKLADQIYVGDMGGQVWRFDIDNNAGGSRLEVTGGVIADISGPEAINNRRFYHAPDVSILNEGGKTQLAVVIGSGWQAHPLDKDIEDRIYLIKSNDVLEPPYNENGDIVYNVLTETDLYDATDNHLGDVSAVNTREQQEAAYKEYYGYTPEEDEEVEAIPPKEGWFIRFTRPGEKMLATSLTIDGEIYYTTYEPKPNTSGCIFSAGIPRLYHIQLSDATPIYNYDNIGLDTELTAPDREVKHLTTQSLPTAPQRLRVDGKDQLCIGTECESLEREESVIKTYWLQQE